MSSLTTRAASPYRAQIMAEAVVSAYIHEIAPAQRPRQRAGAPAHDTDGSGRETGRSSRSARSRRRARATELCFA